MNNGELKKIRRDIDINEPSDEAGYISIVDLNFAPEVLNVAVGTEVAWVNDDTVAHQVESDEKTINYKSEILYPGESFNYIFGTSGEFGYYCVIHPEEKGKVVVEDFFF